MVTTLLEKILCKKDSYTLIILTGIWHCPIFLISQRIHMVHQIHVFSCFFFKIGKKKMGNWRFSKLKGTISRVLFSGALSTLVRLDTTCMRLYLCVFFVKLDKLDRGKYPLKLSVYVIECRQKHAAYRFS